MPVSIGIGVPCNHSTVHVLETDQWIGKSLYGIEERCYYNCWSGWASRWNVHQPIGDNCNIFRIVFTFVI